MREAPLLGGPQFPIGGSRLFVTLLLGLAASGSLNRQADHWRAAEIARARPPTPVALVALGGYGRSELNPYSDIDLLVLHGDGGPDAYVKAASEKFLYSLWDLNL